MSYDDIDLFARLRSVTIVKGLTLPPQVCALLGLALPEDLLGLQGYLIYKKIPYPRSPH